MPANHLEASVRLKPGGAVLDLHGEINRFAQEALNAAYAEAAFKASLAKPLISLRRSRTTPPGVRPTPA